MATHTHTHTEKSCRSSFVTRGGIYSPTLHVEARTEEFLRRIYVQAAVSERPVWTDPEDDSAAGMMRGIQSITHLHSSAQRAYMHVLTIFSAACGTLSVYPLAAAKQFLCKKTQRQFDLQLFEG